MVPSSGASPAAASAGVRARFGGLDLPYRLLLARAAARRLIGRRTARPVAGAPSQPAASVPVPAIDPDAHPFQPDVIEVETDRLPRAARIAVYVLVALPACGLLWAGTARIDRVVHAGGQLITVEPTVQIQPLRTATVQKVLVGPGDRVRLGQVLARLDPALSRADLIASNDRAENLAAEIARLQTEFVGGAALPERPAGIRADLWAVQASHFAGRRAQYAHEVRARESEMQAAAAALEATRVTLRNLEESLKVVQELGAIQSALLATGTGSRLRYLEAHDRVLSVRARIDDVTQSQRELTERAGAARERRDAFQAQWRQQVSRDLLDVTRQHQEVEQTRVKADIQHGFSELTAPEDAVVLSVGKFAPGSVARETEPLMTLVPLRSRLEAEVTIQTRDISWVAEGNAVQIKLEALPFQKFGSLSGTLRMVSADVVQAPVPADERRLGTAAGRAAPATAPAYGARVEIGADHLRDLPDSFRLLPGMALSADITVGDRSVLSYLFDPIVRALKEGLREP